MCADDKEKQLFDVVLSTHDLHLQRAQKLLSISNRVDHYNIMLQK